MALVDQDLESVIHILKINEIRRLGEEQSKMESNNQLSININNDDGINKVADALGNISELAVMFMYEISKYGELDDVEMEIRERAFSSAITGLFKSLFGKNDANAMKFIKMYEQIMEKKIDSVGDKIKHAKGMFDLDSLSDIVNPN
jgi:hypothetical protein